MSMMRQVFIPHLPTRRKPGAPDERVPTVSLYPAERRGRIVLCAPIGPAIHAEDLPEAIADAEKAIARQFQPEDYVVALGHVAVVAAALVAASRKIGGPVQLLVWSKEQADYEQVSVDFSGSKEAA